MIVKCDISGVRICREYIYASYCRQQLVFVEDTIYPNRLYVFMPGRVFQLSTSIVPPDTKTLHKMQFITNALDKGWSVKKRNDSYIFTKKHEGKREIFQNDYLDAFIGEMI